MVTHNITLNVKQQGPIDTGIEVTQGDYGQVRLVMRVKDDDSYITNATGAEIVFSIPNGYFVVGNVTVSSGTYTYIFAGNELQYPGKIAATLTLKFADGRVSSCTFTFECRYNPAYDRRIQAGPYVAELEKLKQQAQEQVEYLETLIEQLQGDFDATVLTRADLVNNGLAANAGIAALDAVQANPNIKDTLAYKIDRLNSKLSIKSTTVTKTTDEFGFVSWGDVLPTGSKTVNVIVSSTDALVALNGNSYAYSYGYVYRSTSATNPLTRLSNTSVDLTITYQ